MEKEHLRKKSRTFGRIRFTTTQKRFSNFFKKNKGPPLVFSQEVEKLKIKKLKNRIWVLVLYYSLLNFAGKTLKEFYWESTEEMFVCFYYQQFEVTLDNQFWKILKFHIRMTFWR